MNQEVCSSCVLEAALAALGKGSAKGAGYDYVIGGFGEDGFAALRDVDFGGLEVRLDLGKSLLCWVLLLVCVFEVHREHTVRHDGLLSGRG